ncbi:MAG: amidophosphoribosyltransferase [Spirochaetales bacterium]|nr:amidophosphoribosyltransferase [Spirochaetales bacterium]
MPLVSEHRVCTRCRNRSYEFASNYSLFVYSGTIKELIYQYKAKDIKDLASLFAEHLAPIIHIRFPGKPVVPVPYRPVRKKKRGWDQVECIAFELKKRFNTNVLKVLRRRNSVAQKILSYEERKTNLSGRIHVRQSFKSVPSEIVLLDDIFTTGATGDECARVLKGFGAETVHMVTIAIDR